MRSTFFGHYPLNDEEQKKLWAEAILVPDTSTLINLFKLMPAARDDLLKALESFGKRLWLPHQVGKEFQYGWRSAFKSDRGAYESLKEDFLKARRSISQSLTKFNRFAPWEDGSPILKIPEFFDGLSKEIDAALDKLSKQDETLAAIEALFDGKVAPEPKQTDITARIKEADARRKAQIPPGYMDERPGDFLIWAEMIEKAKSDKAPIILVTDDTKEDWWWKGPSDETFGPRPELRYEFQASTGQQFYAYRPDRFLALVRLSNSDLVSDETVKEMQQVQNRPVASASSLQRRSEIRDLLYDIVLRPGSSEEGLLAYASNIATTLSLIQPTLAARAQGRQTGDDPDALQKHADELRADALAGHVDTDGGELGAANVAAFDRLIERLRDRDYWNELEHVLDKFLTRSGFRARMEERRRLREAKARGAS